MLDERKAAKSGRASQAAAAVATQPLGVVGVFDRGKFRTLRGPVVGGVRRPGYKVGVLPTLIRSTSRVYRVNTPAGPRALCALECGRLMGVPEVCVEALTKVAPDPQVVSAFGDGFAIPVLRDLLLAVMRACRMGV